MKNDSMFKFSVTSKTDNTAMLKKAMDTLAKRIVVVGYPEDKNVTRSAAFSGIGPAPSARITNASLAYIQDKGSPAAGIPPRPFLEPGVDAVSTKIEKRLAQGARAALGGDEDAVDKSLSQAGLTAQAGVRAFITNGNFQALKASTLAARRRGRFKGTKPLIVTGQLRNAVNYTVRNRSGGL